MYSGTDTDDLTSCWLVTSQLPVARTPLLGGLFICLYKLAHGMHTVRLPVCLC